MAQYAYTSESGSRIISDHGSDVLNSQSDEKQFKPRYYNSIKIEDFVYESWPPLLKYGGGASIDFYDSPITAIVCQGGICIFSYEGGNKSETVGQHGPSTISFLGARKISSFQTNVGNRTEIFKFISATESRAYIYKPDIVEDYSELDFGLITANAGSAVDNGLITQLNGVTIEDRGHILHGWRRRFGFKKVIGEAQAKATNAWIGSGRLVSFGRQVSPAVWGAIADGKVRIFGSADASFTTSRAGGGLTPLSGTAIIGIGIGVIGEGSLRKFSGAAESATWNPDEKQMLFSFTGGLTSEKHTESWVGSGRLRNFAKLEAEKGTFDYLGSGSVLKLKPRKPSSHLLSDLANFTLEVHESLAPHWKGLTDPNDHWDQTKKLGAVQLNQLTEWSHEKHTEVYTQDAIVEFVRKDYGNLIVGQTSCVANSGTISTNTTSSSGCIKVAPGTTLAIAPGSTYTIQSVLSTPTSFEDYGLVSESNAPQQRDYGWILDTSDLRSPYGLFRFVSHTGAYATKQYHFTSDGTPPIFKITGDITLPLDVSEFGGGNLFAMGGASESTSVLLGGDGLYRFFSDTDTTRLRNFEGSGSLKKFSGSAESISWNPLEKQILFSINGVGTEKHTESYVGSGEIRKLSGSAESVRWSAQHTTGLYRIDGDSHNSISKDFVGSGRIPVFTGAAESLTFNPTERDMLFSFIGGITSEKHTEVYVGSGRLRNFAKLEAEKQTFDYVGSGSINLLPRKPDCYELSELANFTLDTYVLRSEYINLGNIDFYDGYTNLGDAQLKWITCELGHEKHTEAYNNGACVDNVDLDYGNLIAGQTSCVANSGTISTNTTATSGCIKVATGTTLAIAPGSTYTLPTVLSIPSSLEDYGLVADANAPEWRDYGHILDTTSKVCPFGAFEITGSAKTHFVENIVSTGYSVSGKAGLSLFGAGATFWTPPYFGRNLSRLSGTVAESFTPTTEIGSGILFSMGGSSETTSVSGYGGGLFKIGSQAYTLFSLLHIGSGTVKVIGSGAESITPATHIGSGSLKKFSGAAESATWNPLERQMLFSFTGTGSETFTANPPEEGTQVRISGDAFPVFFIPKYPGYGVIKVSGDSVSKTTKPFIGSGSLKKFSGAAESITFNPEEKQLLFSFTGSCTEKVTLNPPEEGTNIRLRGEAVYKLDSSYVGSGRIIISGDAVSKTTNAFVGSGSLKKFSGAAESITFNPEEKQLLFSFTGTGSERTFVIPPEGDGILFTFGGSTATSAAAYESTGLFRVGGFTDFTRSRDFVGSGTFKKFSGAAESITFNPDEKQMLFSFTGSGSESTVSIPPEGDGRISIYPEASDYRFTPNWNSVGGVRIEIQSAYRFAPVWIGSGSLKKFSGAAESITFNPEEKQLLFSFTGTGSESTTTKTIVKGGTIRLDGTPRVRWVPNNIGSGTIFVSGTAKTHYVPDIEGTGGLWTWNGAAESQAIAITSIPTLFRVYGNGDISRSRPYIGSGSLRKLGGSAESITFNPDEKQMLFSFLGQGTTTRTRSESGQGTVKTLGESTVRFSPVYFGSGTARVSGESIVTRARDFVGFGSLRKLSGAAESLTFNPEEKQMLFSFLGVGAESRTSRELSQSGVLAVRGTSGDPLLTFAEQKQVEIDITGDSIDLRSHSYAGSGRISNVNNVDEAFVRKGYEGSGRISIHGVGLVQVQLFQPPHTQVWII